MPFEDVEGKGTEKGPTHLTIRANRPQQAYLTAAAVREFFAETERVRFRVDRDRSLLALLPDNGDESFSLSEAGGGGGAVAIRQALRALDVEEGRISETHRCEVSLDGESGYVVADLSSVVEDATDDVHCQECGKRFAESGLGAHVTKAHESAQDALKNADPDDIGEPFPDGEEVADS